MNISKFYKWLVTFLAFLLVIPFLTRKGGDASSSVLGVVFLVLVVLAIFLWVRKLNRHKDRKKIINLTAEDNLWLERYIPFYSGLSKKDKTIFRSRVSLFLGQVKVTEIDKDIPDKSTCFYVASSAVIAFWGLPYYNYSDLSEVLVYPSNFNMDNTLTSTGRVQGKVYHGGLMNNTMILSLPALVSGFSIANDKKNVGVHEFAHLLDKADGVMDGVPYDMCKKDREIWTQLANEAIPEIIKGKSTIPDYGATSHTEFFAVLVEYYKECPHLLKIKHPELFAVLDRYFSKG